ncbi:hemocyte protein-glutamine gamma-glutamyltransferase-like [Macrosteles quadrilineatus]|uniref:hemocyte protein-glutamine gamma-glutamyltransferase-like n=1 Tax=Macrosteles quadrilineatus TaxID=74068 RepID=UPI0023E1CEB5|nr:hemocyte protein-glutamine gamma-glutamyltransferase-like [Macrosteles quadrilineatus]
MAGAGEGNGAKTAGEGNAERQRLRDERELERRKQMLEIRASMKSLSANGSQVCGSETPLCHVQRSLRVTQEQVYRARCMMGEQHAGDGMTKYHLKMKAKLVLDYERRRRNDKLSHVEVHDDGTLTIEVTDLYALDNAAAHHTDHFLVVADLPGVPVLRRGLPFYLAVRFCRPLDTAKDMVSFVFELGPRPEIICGTRHVISVSSKPEVAANKSSWDARVHRQDSNVTIFQVRIPVKCPVGIWHCNIVTSKVDTTRSETKEFNIEKDIYILFNPWCPDDGVFLDGDAREQFVSSDYGRVWTGTHRHPIARPWVFGQYDDVVLPVAMLLLEESSLEHSRRGNIVEVARAIGTALRAKIEKQTSSVSSRSSAACTGSVAVLERWLKETDTSHFGQTWVCSSVAVTVFRALGIPSRPVTSYISAHGSLTLVRYMSDEGEWLDQLLSDNLPWGFHVWVEAWMARPDLTEGHNGWQVIDPNVTGKSICGPTSVEAVRQGNIGQMFDTAMVYATLNGELLHMKEDPGGEKQFMKLRPTQYGVGCKIVTDSVRPDIDTTEACFIDVTKTYKNEKGSAEEHKKIVNSILGFPPSPKPYAKSKREKNEEVLFELVEINQVMFGQPFSASIRVQNKGQRDLSISVSVSAYSVLSNGEKAHFIGLRKNTYTLQPGQKDALVLSGEPVEYVDKLVDHSLIKVLALGEIKESGIKWCEEDDFQMIKPKLTLEVKGVPKVGQECTVSFSFQNPLDIMLSHCIFCMEGPGLVRPILKKHRDVMPNELVTLTECIVPKIAGNRNINASFTSRQLTDILGSSSLYVE